MPSTWNVVHQPSLFLHKFDPFFTIHSKYLPLSKNLNQSLQLKVWQLYYELPKFFVPLFPMLLWSVIFGTNVCSF